MDKYLFNVYSCILIMFDIYNGFDSYSYVLNHFEATESTSSATRPYFLIILYQ
mgnify:CR=1 FL=1